MRQILSENSPQVFLVTETQLRSNTGINLEGYVFFGRKREGRIGGGVAALVRNDIRSNITAHLSDRNIEMLWIGVQRKNTQPLFLGVYYGRQETRTSKDEINREMLTLKEEIIEKQNEGEILIAMDANAKVGLLGEEVSRNGKELTKVLNELDLLMINGTSKCKGAITRQNTSDEEEKSAIDFVIVSRDIFPLIRNMSIDEEGLLKVTGKNPSDHNTITINLSLPSAQKFVDIKTTGWNIKADEEKWQKFRDELRRRQARATQIITDSNRPMDERYKKYFRELETAARVSIGKTTFKKRKTDQSI